jgi:proteic killer suppression protein
MIRSFSCHDTESIWLGRSSRKFPGDIQNRAFRKLRQLDAAKTLEDLRNPPGNRLETLKGNRAGQMSIRVKTISGASAFDGRQAMPSTWKSRTTIERDGTFEGQ